MLRFALYVISLGSGWKAVVGIDRRKIQETGQNITVKLEVEVVTAYIVCL